MDRAVEQSHRIAKVAIDALRELNLLATPRNIEIWYAHIEGHLPALSRDIQSCLDEDGRIDQEAADALYHLHIAQTDLSTDVMELVTKFETEITALNSVIATSGENAHVRTEELENLSKRLGAEAGDQIAVRALMENVVKVVRKMGDDNSVLEQRLSESAGEVSALRKSIEHIQKEAMLDGLTGLNNRRTFDLSLEQEFSEAMDRDQPLSLILADIDHFKSFNDRWGHQTGDQVLRLVAEVMKSNVKGQDILARFGGEEFAVVLPETSLEDAKTLADRIRRAVEKRRLKKRSTGEDLGIVTISMGVALIKDQDTIHELIERADACLYCAKDRGRNLVVTEAEYRSPDEGDNISVA